MDSAIANTDRRSIGIIASAVSGLLVMDDTFSIADFNPSRHRLIGKGLWGYVYDLGDGTVLKLVREHCPGIGNGRRKVENEWKALIALAQIASIKKLIPRAIGVVPDNSPVAATGFAVWLRMERIEGQGLSVALLAAMSRSDRNRCGEAIGTALAELHDALRILPADFTQGVDDPYAEIKRAVSEIPFYHSVIATLERRRAKIPHQDLQICHNDFNITNLLFRGHDVSGILDFAECRLGYREKDISDILKDAPSLEDTLVRAYEQASATRIDADRIKLGLAENDLYGALINERGGRTECIQRDRDRLLQKLTALGYG